MKPLFDVTNLTPGKVKRLKTLMALLATSKALQNASVRVVHNYSQRQGEHDVTFEALDGGQQGYISGRGGTLRCGDHVILWNGSETKRYQVDEIDYDTKPSDWWIALLHPCSERVGDRRVWMKPAEGTCDPIG